MSDTDNAVDVCALADLDEVDARGFEYESDRLREGFVVRRGEDIFAYRNICPHAGNRLNWKPHAFLSKKRDLIMCAVHGAIFDIGTGRCVDGPCPGRKLSPLRVELVKGRVVVHPD